MCKGMVYIVGAGPGDPELITVKGLKYLRSADVILYDRLVDPRLLEHAKKGAEIIYVGKEKGENRITQEEINELLIKRATKGKTVVRLKGGDPFVFGRGGEEAIALCQAGVFFEIVPGISSVLAPACAGIPLTQRGYASSFTVIAGCRASSEDEAHWEEWEKIAALPGTLVVLMGLSVLPRIVEVLLAHGKPLKTPVALIRWASQPYQETVVGTLADVVEKSKPLKPPVLIVIGDVVSLREQIVDALSDQQSESAYMKNVKNLKIEQKDPSCSHLRPME